MHLDGWLSIIFSYLHVWFVYLTSFKLYANMIVVSHTGTPGATYFVVYLETVKVYSGTKLFEVCVYICWLIIHCIQTEIYSKLNLKKRIWFVMNCTNSDRSDDFFTSEKHDEHLNNHKSWMKCFASEKK